MLKAFLVTIGVAVYLYATAWTFNHVNPWFSFFMFAGLIYVALFYLLKQSNKL